jgi:hypothetical protein
MPNAPHARAARAWRFEWPGCQTVSQSADLIKGCTSSDELLSLVEQRGQAFNQIHCATVLSHAAQLVTRHRCAIPRSGIERMV